ncbi:MAG: ion transporter [Magnetovibrionaceae bacterium]
MSDAETPKGWIVRLGEFVEGTQCQRFITALIVCNAITLGLETSDSVMAEFGGILKVLDRAFLAFFVAELLAKLVYRRLNFFKDGWNVFDFVIITIALIPASGNLSVLRALRILRVLRLISVVPSMRKVVQALLSAIPGIGSVGLLIMLIFYVSGVLTTKLFGDSFPEWFGNIGGSMYTLFQVMTLESWSMGIVRPVMEVYPYAWVFFVPFILLTSFAVLNLFIGIIVDAMQMQQQAEHQVEVDQAAGERHAIQDELAGLRQEVAELKELLKAER